MLPRVRKLTAIVEGSIAAWYENLASLLFLSERCMTKAGEKDRDRFHFQHLRIHVTVLATPSFEVQYLSYVFVCGDC